MRKFVYGRDVVMLAQKNGSPDYYPFACAENVRLSMSSELLPSSTADTGNWETFVKSGKNGWTAELSGVLVLEDEVDTLWFGWEMFLLQVRDSGLNLKFVFTDKDDNVKFATGFAWIPNAEISGTMEDFANYITQLQGSGPLDLSGLLPNIEPDMGDIRIEWITSGAEPNVVQDSKLVGLAKADIKEVSWEGDDKWFIITTGTPTDRQVLLDNVAGTLKFKNNFENGDYVWALVAKKN